jgi:hypothetical protein
MRKPKLMFGCPECKTSQWFVTPFPVDEKKNPSFVMAA